MRSAGGVCLEMGYREKLPRESEVILKIPVKEPQCGPVLAYFESVAYF